LARRTQKARCLLVAQGRSISGLTGEIIAEAARANIAVQKVQRSELDRLSPHHQGLALMIPAAPPMSLAVFLDSLSSDGPALIVALDHIEDPHNLGALARSAAAFGSLGLLIPKDRSAPMNQAARAASAGASETLAVVRVVNLVRALEELKKAGFWLVAAEGGSGVPLAEFEFPERCVLILGSEGRGLGREVARQADFTVHIPLADNPAVDSLNVSNAGAILMYAFTARRL
jgi:23S rRNA (guanosine2251-2'-O)-methyltransferase